MAVRSKHVGNIRMVRDPAFFGIKNEKKAKKSMPYVDVSDDEDHTSKSKELKRKVPLINGHKATQFDSFRHKNKKRRFSDHGDNFFQQNDSNAAGPLKPVSVSANSSNMNAKVRLIQEQRKNLPIATGQFFFLKKKALGCVQFRSRKGGTGGRNSKE